MAMTSRSFSYYESRDELKNIDTLKTKLNNFVIQREEGGHTLSTLIKLNGFQGNLGNGIKILEGTVFDEHMKTSSKIKKNISNLDGIPNYTIESDPYIDIRAGSFWILNDGMLVNKRKGDRHFVSNVINHALDTDVKQYSIDLAEVASDYTNNWLGGIIDRSGNWQKGTLHGDDLRNDDCVGREFIACTKNQVGGYTEHFGGKTKFKVTREGVVTLYTNLGEDIENFLRFTRDEIQDYFLS